eukprot:764497-Hanusia_phi.AAC.5
MPSSDDQWHDEPGGVLRQRPGRVRVPVAGSTVGPAVPEYGGTAVTGPPAVTGTDRTIPAAAVREPGWGGPGRDRTRAGRRGPAPAAALIGKARPDSAASPEGNCHDPRDVHGSSCGQVAGTRLNHHDGPDRTARPGPAEHSV